jgi:hypothetical protein
VLHDLQRLGSLTTIWRHLSDTWDSAGAETAESGVKRCRILRPFYPDVQRLRIRGKSRKPKKAKKAKCETPLRHILLNHLVRLFTRLKRQLMDVSLGVEEKRELVA